VQGKHGMVMLVDSNDFKSDGVKSGYSISKIINVHVFTKKEEAAMIDLNQKVKMISQANNSPILLIFNRI
jgi:hypothetical protein